MQALLQRVAPGLHFSAKHIQGFLSCECISEEVLRNASIRDLTADPPGLPQILASNLRTKLHPGMHLPGCTCLDAMTGGK
jgi:hypothetical protein